MPSTGFTRIQDGLMVVGDLIVGGAFEFGASSVTNSMISSSANIARTKLAQDALKKFPVNLTDLRIWDAMASILTGTAGTDDLALITGTFGSAAPTVRTSDAKNTSVTQRARFLCRVPESYDAGEDFQIRFNAGMITTVANGSATIDLEVYEANKDGTLGGSPTDLVSTSAISINSLTFANCDFVLNAAGLSPGDELDCRVTIAITDSATGTAVIGAFGGIDRMCDIRG